MKSNVPVAEAINDEAVLPERVQEALGDLIGAAKEGLLALLVEVGLGVLHELLELEVDEVVGPKGRWNRERSAVRHGHEDGEVTLGGGVAVKRPRVRTADGESEVTMRTYEHFADRDRLGRLALERILAGVSTRKHRRVQEPVGEQTEKQQRSTSKSAVSRAFVQRTREALWHLMSRQLADLRLAVVMLDGIEAQGPHERRRVGDHDRGQQTRARPVVRQHRERHDRQRALVRPGLSRPGRRAGLVVRDRRLQSALNAVANFEFERVIDRVRGPRRRNRS